MPRSCELEDLDRSAGSLARADSRRFSLPLKLPQLGVARFVNSPRQRLAILPLLIARLPQLFRRLCSLPLDPCPLAVEERVTVRLRGKRLWRENNRDALWIFVHRARAGIDGKTVNGGGNMYRRGGAKMYQGLGGSLSA